MSLAKDPSLSDDLSALFSSPEIIVCPGDMFYKLFLLISFQEFEDPEVK